MSVSPPSLMLTLWDITRAQMETWPGYREHDSSWETARQKRSNGTSYCLLLRTSEAHVIVYACKEEMEVSTFLEVPAHSSLSYHLPACSPVWFLSLVKRARAMFLHTTSPAPLPLAIASSPLLGKVSDKPGSQLLP